MGNRFRTLDAMRGFAAVNVVLFHTSWLYGAPCKSSQSCAATFGYLAVDLFFVLSGFVIAHAYDERIARGLTVSQFMAARLKRLLPIYLVGLAIGLVLPLRTAVLGYGGGKQALATAAINALMLPFYSPAQSLIPFPLDPAAWSLFFELWVANLLYACLFRQLRGRRLAAIVIGSLAALVFAQSIYGFIGMGSFWADFPGGFPRVIFSFFTGVGLCRLRRRYAPPPVAAWLLLVIAIASFWLPLHGIAARIYEVAAVVFLYPALVYLGSTAVERRPWIGAQLGDLSYTLYVIHQPLVIITAVVLPAFGIGYAPLMWIGYLATTVSVSAVLSRIDLMLQRRLRQPHAASV